MDATFFIRNRNKLFNELEEGSMTIILSGKAPKKSADEAYPFTPNRNFYYLTGISEEDIILVLAKIGGDEVAQLFIHKPDPVMAKWVGETISEEEAKKVSGIEHISYLEHFESILHRHLNRPQVTSIYFDLERDSFSDALTKEQSLAKSCKEKYPHLSIKNAYPIISALRTIKAPEEIKKLKEAISITKEGINALMTHAQSGIYEYQLEAYFDFVLKSRGVKDFAFKTIAASGINGTILHYSNNDTIIPEDSLILFDLGAQYEYYNADITRTFPVSGKFTERQKLIYNIVLKAHDAVVEAIKPGVTIRSLNDLTEAIYLEELQKIGLAKTMEDVNKYYFHSVSHLLGLDTHDVGERNIVLQEGMVLTVEPGLYIEEEAIGIRIEDDVLVTATGSDVLSQDIIRTVDEIEAFMNNR